MGGNLSSLKRVLSSGLNPSSQWFSNMSRQVSKLRTVLSICTISSPFLFQIFGFVLILNNYPSSSRTNTFSTIISRMAKKSGRPTPELLEPSWPKTLTSPSRTTKLKISMLTKNCFSLKRKHQIEQKNRVSTLKILNKFL